MTSPARRTACLCRKLSLPQDSCLPCPKRQIVTAIARCRGGAQLIPDRSRVNARAKARRGGGTAAAKRGQSARQRPGAGRRSRGTRGGAPTTRIFLPRPKWYPCVSSTPAYLWRAKIAYLSYFLRHSFAWTSERSSSNAARVSNRRSGWLANLANDFYLPRRFAGSSAATRGSITLISVRISLPTPVSIERAKLDFASQLL
ncbi:hypothetical protein L917_20533 [Phytophthora nicotianae]|uniref:Uncharacterized protein n=1 Tax=Phytophthora nicotianae TaxID=4792 RepID=W2K2P5_PHYNI|nr:hypothetical protein L917_20533 [Phytophthora nicotianae]